MSTFDKIFGKIEEIIAGICLTIMSILAFTNVLARYFFHASFSFSDEITTYLFVLLSLIGASIAAKRHEHLGFRFSSSCYKKNTKFHKLFNGRNIYRYYFLFRHINGN